MANAFDQFDAATKPKSGGNAFDQFDKPKSAKDKGVGETFTGVIGGAWDKLRRDAADHAKTQASVKGQGSWADAIKDTALYGRDLANVGGVMVSPFVAAQEAFVVQPGAKGMDAVLPATRMGRHGYEPVDPETSHDMNANALRTAVSAVMPKRMGPPVPAGNPLATVAKGPTMAETVAKFDQAGVTPRLASVKGKGAAATANAVAENPVGGNVRAAMATDVADAGASAARTAGKYGSPTSNSTLGEAIQKDVTGFTRAPKPGAAPSARVTFGERAENLYTKAEGLIGNTDQPIPMARTQAALKAANSAFADANLNERFSNPVLRDIAADIENAGGTLSWNDAKLLRSKIRTRLLADPALRGTADDAAVSSIYQALTEDLGAGAKSIATSQGGAAAGTAAERSWQRANTYYRAGMSRVDRALNAVFDASKGENVYDQITAAASTGARADIRKLSAIKRSVTPENWGDLAATVIDRMGKPTAGAAGAGEGGFSVSTFLTNYNKISPEARGVLFGQPGAAAKGGGALRGELDNLAEVVAKLKDVEKAANASKSGVSLQNSLTTGGVMSVPLLLFTGHPVGAASVAGGLGGLRLTGTVMTSPTAVRWLARMGEAAGKGSQAFAARQATLEKASRGNAALQALAAAIREAQTPPPVTAAPAAAEQKSQ